LAAAFAIGASAVPASAAFPGDNGKIVFSSNQSGFFELYSMFPDGSGLTQLTTPNQVPCSRGPWVSADGTRIAFHGNPTQACSGTNFQIYTVNADATGLTQLTFGGYNVTPAWSPDGSKIAYVSNQTTDGSCQIFEIGASGGTPKQITYLGPEGLGGLSWSPDSTKIVYGTAASSVQCPGPNGALNVGNLEIHVMNASDGSNDVRLETDGAFVAGTLNTSRHPDWSPDG
jgi:TolB protein